ncbi:MAG: MotA/TolQ/ExbB proton channel family protein [Methanobacteriaceae archaeon]
MINETMNVISIFTDGIYVISEDILHTITQCFLIPVIIILVIFFVYSLINIGMIIAEYRIRRKTNNKINTKGIIIRIANSFKENSDKISDNNNSSENSNLNTVKNEIENSNLLNSEKEVLNAILENADLDYETQKSLARELVEEKELNLFKRLEKIDIMAKISPALGLMGTLIPLGPGLLALGSGDTQTLANSLIIAFDTTVLGMATASLAFVISKIRKRWYLKDIDQIDNLAEFTLEVLNAKKKN